MDEQQKLPGGTIGTPGKQLDNRWVRPGWKDDPKDTKLARTSMRWHDNAWYVITAGEIGTHGSTKLCAVRRSGPYEDIVQAEERLTAETGAPSGDWGHEPSNEQQGAVDATVREGLTHRLYAAGQEWVRQTGGNMVSSGVNGLDIGRSWERQELLDFHGNTHSPDLYEQWRKVLRAAEAYRVWQAS